MDDLKNDKVKEEKTNENTALTEDAASSDVKAAEEPKLEAPIEPKLEAPTDMLVEAHEKDGKPSEDTQVVNEAPPTEKAETPEATETTDEASSAEPSAEDETPTAPTAEPTASDLAKWYIIHTYSGHENKVAKSLRQRVESMGFEQRIFDIIVPVRNTIKVSQGKKESVKEKIFPGYVLVKMILDDESWLLVRTTQGVTAFIGAGNKPTPISEKEVKAIQKFMEADSPLFTTTFTVGEAVKIVDGPFADFLGTVENIDEARGKIRVLVSIFGRETPVELDFLQIMKL